jgi:hypothetical protein
LTDKEEEDLLQQIQPFNPEPPKEDPVAALKTQLDSEKAARVAAEKRAHELDQVAHKARNEAGDSQMQLVVAAIETVESNQLMLKGAYAEAMRSGDFEAAADLQLSMGDNSAKLLQLKNGKLAMEAQPKPEAPKPVIDPVEALANQLTPRSAAWVRAHPEYVRNPTLNKKMVAAHELTVADGILEDTDEYFRSVEALLFKKTAPAVVEEDTQHDPTKEAAQRAPASPPPAAPASRGSGNKRGYTLTAAQREAAQIAGQSEEEYAQNVQLLKAEGRMQ